MIMRDIWLVEVTKIILILIKVNMTKKFFSLIFALIMVIASQSTL